MAPRLGRRGPGPGAWGRLPRAGPKAQHGANGGPCWARAGLCSLGNGEVSIHARTRRATAQAHGGVAAQKFQSTPARGGRRTTGNVAKPLLCFNPRPHTAGDPQVILVQYGRALFQSTPAHGGRPQLGVVMDQTVQFQSTPAHGGRHPPTSPLSCQPCFNPRPHTAGDLRCSSVRSPDR